MSSFGPFLFASLLLALSPGPDLLLISSYSATGGFRPGFKICVGVLLAGLIQTAAVAFGLGELMQAAPSIATGVRSVGALYLGYLGVKMIWSWTRRGKSDHDNRPSAEAAISDSTRRLVTRGMLNNLLNPKALLFFSLFLPQFTTSSQNLVFQILLLGVTLSVVAFAVNMAAAVAFTRVRGLFRSPKGSSGHSDGLLGFVFVGLSLRLATSN